MKLGRRQLLVAGAVAAPVPAGAQQKDRQMLEDLARRAAIYLFPVYEMYRTRWNATVSERSLLRQKLNRLLHVPVLATHRSRVVTTPNNDTLYSSAWLDRAVEPLFLTLPDMGQRYYSFALMDMFTDNFACVCRRLDGGRPQPRMIVGPRWAGDVEAGVTLVRAPTNGVWLLGRLLVDGEPDLETARLLQGKVLLETPDMHNERRIIEMQELMRQRTVPPPEAVADWPAPSPDDPFDLFEVAMRTLGESPLRERDAAVMEEFAPLRLRPGRKFDVRSFSDGEREAIRRGIAAGIAEIRTPARPFGSEVNGWRYPQRNLGNFGDDYAYRATIALTGLAALETAEATYLMCDRDEAGQPLDGSGRYMLRFEPGQLPPARAFWSLAMYEVTPEGRAYFIDNPLSRYAIGDRTPGLNRNADGSLEIFLQAGRPAGERLSNWLPAPAGPMRLVLRAYEPAEPLLDGSWRMPAVRKMVS
jgi:hypothetical protein